MPTAKPSGDVNTTHTTDPDGGTSNLASRELAQSTHDLSKHIRSRGDVYRPPNVILIMTDDEKFSEIQDGFHRDGFKSMMRDHGTVFSKFQVVRSVCSPSRATFLTGQYNQNQGFGGSGLWGVPGWNALLPEMNLLIFRWLATGGAHVDIIDAWYYPWSSEMPDTLPITDVRAFSPDGGEFTIIDHLVTSTVHKGTYTGLDENGLVGVVPVSGSPTYLATGDPIFPSGSTAQRLVQTGFVGKYNNDYGDNDLDAGDANPLYATPSGIDHWRAFCYNYSGAYHWQALAEDYDADGARLAHSLYGPDAHGTSTTYYNTDYCADAAAELIGLFTSRSPSDKRYKLPFYLQVCPVTPHTGSGVGPVDQTHRVPPISGDPTNRAGRMSVYNSWMPPFFDAAAGTAYPNIDLTDTANLTSAIGTEQSRLQGLVTVDDLVGTIISALTAAGELENTIIVYTSDNGWCSGENGDWQGKNSTFDAAMKVPFCWRGPGIPEGVTNPARVANVDWGSTVCDIFDVNPSLVQDGMSMWPCIAEPTLYDDRALYLTGAPQTTGRHYSAGYNAVMTKHWKYGNYLNHSPDPDLAVPVLFDLVNDPWEQNNLFNDGIHADIQSQLDTLLTQLRICSGDSCRVNGP